MNLSIFPIRHHGPGSARSLAGALETVKPDIVLVEGPADANPVLPFLAREDFKPPVALLGYVGDNPARASFWPFAAFSPEYVAFQWAARSGVAARFMDLPASATLGFERDDEVDSDLQTDPLRVLAEAAGYTDFERWWETLVEARGDSGDVFAAVLEVMAAVRADAPMAVGHEAQREAHMRQIIRAAQKDGFQNIAVVCGAWHAPRLEDLKAYPVKDDAALLKGLPRAKVMLTWVPWTHGRLSMHSGYGAGVRSPGYYHHLFTTQHHVTEQWFARTAQLLRAEKLEASSASVIEATRLANTLAGLRGRALPGLDELNEAALSVFGWDSDLPLRLIERQLIVGEALGEVPSDTPTVPLAQDLARQQRTLRLKVQPEQQELTLDLRQDHDLARSALFHRLNLLGIPWAQERSASGRGTFKEAWTLAWQPEFSVRLVQASRYGQTVADAAGAQAIEAARTGTALSELTTLLEAVRYADLPGALPAALDALDARAAVGADVTDLLLALAPLARLARYGDVRGRGGVVTAANEAPARVLRTLLTRACVGLPNAAIGLAGDAAQALQRAVDAGDASVRLLDAPDALAEWRAALLHLADRPEAHPLLNGDAVRRLRDSGELDVTEIEWRVSLALGAQRPGDVTAWLDGFLGHSAALLLHDSVLLELLDGWLTALEREAFQEALPLLRRVFARYEKPERRAIGEALRGGGRERGEVIQEMDEERAMRVVPVVLRLLGVRE
ncbi:DUF5682 family protein [Deinococcus humi]|uniref:4-aminobutyrate aminotransferase n=1 Tax=Deinococcus humi TaxID=662880 RepID=A0A7W8NGS5_9DEIO|nr:DUF5682 family protein [Deinococcus humi]MBB5364123.1 hypothetical protein [Deinococcus humi]GGO32279.1 hypothetical protein GCM10008949_29480 [Deinococcus humi]